MRRFILTLCICMLMVGSTGVVNAYAAPSAARSALQSTIDEIIELLKSPDLKNSSAREALLAKVEAKIYTVFDFEEFSARTVGGHWSKFSDRQKKDFQEAFSQLLYHTYVTKLEEYDGQTINFNSEKASKKGDKVEILTTIPYNAKEIPISYRMLDKNGKWVVYDVIVENISLVQNFRGQFQEILKNQSPDQLIGIVKKKTQETINANKAKQA